MDNSCCEFVRIVISDHRGPNAGHLQQDDVVRIKIVETIEAVIAKKIDWSRLESVSDIMFRDFGILILSTPRSPSL